MPTVSATVRRLTRVAPDYTAMIMFVGAETAIKWYAQQLQQRGGRWFADYVGLLLYIATVIDGLTWRRRPVDCPDQRLLRHGQVALHSNLLNARDETVCTSRAVRWAV